MKMRCVVLILLLDILVVSSDYFSISLKKLSSAENFWFFKLPVSKKKKNVDISLTLFFASMIVTCPSMEGVQMHTQKQNTPATILKLRGIALRVP